MTAVDVILSEKQTFEHNQNYIVICHLIVIISEIVSFQCLRDTVTLCFSVWCNMNLCINVHPFYLRYQLIGIIFQNQKVVFSCQLGEE